MAKRTKPQVQNENPQQPDALPDPSAAPDAGSLPPDSGDPARTSGDTAETPDEDQGGGEPPAVENCENPDAAPHGENADENAGADSEASEPPAPDGDPPADDDQQTEQPVDEPESEPVEFPTPLCPKCLKELHKPAPLGTHVQNYRGVIDGRAFSRIIRRRFKCDKCGQIFFETEYR